MKTFCCEQCRREAGELRTTMIVCPTCGNKRCPKADHHENKCTGSNEPGQVGVNPSDTTTERPGEVGMDLPDAFGAWFDGTGKPWLIAVFKPLNGCEPTRGGYELHPEGWGTEFKFEQQLPPGGWSKAVPESELATLKARLAEVEAERNAAMTTTDDDWPDGFASSPPDRPGFWQYMETHNREPETLLIVGDANHAEAADGYWESTDVRTMLGRWKFLKGR